ncbi:MAG: hypothetical protein RLZZ337_1154 [Bacteroidota bacterium]|jgi:ligand-binding sensor domain-containing protein
MWVYLKDVKTSFWQLWEVHKVFSICIAILFCLLFSKQAKSQDDIRFHNITVKDGLSMGTITAITQDKQGFTWIGTAEGLHRFDGIQFTIYKHEENSTNSLSDSYITCLLVKDNKIYIGNHSGKVDVLNLDNYAFSTFAINTISPGFDLPILSLCNYNGKVVASTAGGGLWQIQKTISPLKTTNRSGSQQLISTSNNAYFILDRDSLFSLDNLQLKYTFSISNAHITTICYFQNGYLIGTNRGLIFSNLDFENVQNIALPPKRRRINQITSVVARNNVAWVGTLGGILKVHNGTVTHLQTESTNPYSLINNQLTSIYLDRNNVLWAGTISGLSIFAPELKKFGLLQQFNFNGKTYNNNVYCTYEDKQGSIWLGTLSSGLIKLNKDHQIDKIYESIQTGQNETKAVRCLLQDSDNQFWVGTRDEGLFIFNPLTEAFSPIANSSNGKIGSNTIRCVFEDSEKVIWIGAQDGLYKYEKTTNTYIHYEADSNSINNSIYQITENPTTGDLIIASFRGGLQFFNKQNGSFTKLQYNPDNNNSLSNNNVMCLSWIDKQELLIGTYGGGLNIYNLQSGQFTHITEEDGLINNAVYGICTQGDSVCWLSTNNGLVRYDLKKKTFKNFKPEHYLQSTEYNEGAFLKASNGLMYFGGVNGLNYFNPTSIPYERSPVPIYFTDIRGIFTNNRPNEYILDYLESRLEIDFVAPNFSNPKGIRYSYKLSGFDNDWVQSIGNTAVYPQINPGTYTFSVTAQDEFGNWSSISKDLIIKVQPPFWQRWWFILLCALTVASLIYALFRFRTREIARSYKMQLVDSELSALRSQMNPHFIFNSLNSIQYYILKKEPKEAYTYLSKFANLMRKILQNSRLKQISVADEVEWLNLYLELEKLRMDNRLNYTIKTIGMEDTSQIFIPTMLLQPFVENSIVHGLLPKEGERTLDIALVKDQSKLKCTIQDNGIGRKASEEINKQRTSKHKSSGLELTKKRIQMLSNGKSDFDVEIQDLEENGLGVGTRVIIFLPIFTETQ